MRWVLLVRLVKLVQRGLMDSPDKADLQVQMANKDLWDNRVPREKTANQERTDPTETRALMDLQDQRDFPVTQVAVVKLVQRERTVTPDLAGLLDPGELQDELAPLVVKDLKESLDFLDQMVFQVQMDAKVPEVNLARTVFPEQEVLMEHQVLMVHLERRV